MKFLRFSFFMLALIISGSTMAQSQKELSQLMRERNEYYFTLNVNDLHEIQSISELCSVDGFKGSTVVCYANQQQYDRLLKAGYQPNLQTPPSLLEEAKMWDGNRATYAWDSYPTYEQLESMIQGFPSSTVSGRTCTYLELGTLSSNRKIMGVRINNGDTIGKPKFLYSSTIHGDETTGMILLLRLIDELCTSTDSRIDNLVNNLDIFIFPDANPDGTYYGGNSTVTGSRRANANGVDMNRNYPDPHSSQHPDGNAWQSETQWFMKLAQDYPFVMAANFHGGAEVMNYPWDNTKTRHADDAWWQYISNEYVANTRTVYSGYMTDTYSSGITNGADWYMIGGGRQDYMNGYCQCREITIECSTTKTLAASQLNNYWNYNHTALLAYMEQCLNGVHGKVIDANTNQALDGVTITVQDHDDQYSIVSTHEDGYFHRPIKGGSYTFAIEKDGYCPYYVDVTLTDDQSVNLGEIPLTPGSCLVANFTASSTNVSLGSSISFTDASYGDIVSWSWTFEGGTPSTSTAQNPTNIQYNTAGTYDVTLTITDSEGISATLTKEDYITAAAQYNMSNTTVTTCEALFYDSGGASSDYGNNLTYTMTFYPETEGAMISVAFSEFSTESSYDYLYIYDGISTSATMIGQYDGTNSPGTVTATNSEGALTFKFTSDRATAASGWVATVSCVMVEHTITATADPVEGGTVAGAGTFSPGETCTLTATAAEGYRFVHWTENGEVVSNDAAYSFTVTVDRTLVAVFGSTDPIDITVSANPARGGSVSGGGKFLFGETCTVIATPNEGYSFANWTENGEVVSDQATYSFEVNNARELVANFTFDAAISGNCYYIADNVGAGSYVMGHIEGTTLASPTHNNATSVTTTSTPITPTEYGFSVDEEATLPQVTLTAYQNGQYYISYNGRYLARSNYGTNLTWGTNTSIYGRWHIDSNGIYLTSTGGYGGNSTYYLYYNNGSFALSTTQQNNITFYTEGDCPVSEFTIAATAEPTEGGTIEGVDTYYLGEMCTLIATANEGYQFVNWTENGEEVSTEAEYSFEVTAGRELVAHFEEVISTVTQTHTLHQGWNWWSTYIEIDLEQLENALGDNGITILAQNGYVTNESTSWEGSLETIQNEKMYRICVSDETIVTLTGILANPTDHTINLNTGWNWVGFISDTPMNLETALAGFEASEGDIIKGTVGTGFAEYYEGYGWYGSLKKLQPGMGYMIRSAKATSFQYPN